MNLANLFKRSCLTILSLSIFPNSAFAMGVSPSTIDISGIMPENQVEQILSLSRADPKEDEYVDLTLSGEGSEAISLESNHILLPKGISQVPVHFTISPKALNPGDYNTNIKIQLGSSEATKGTTEVLPSLSVYIKFSVTLDQIEKGSVQMASADEISEGDFFYFYYQWLNEGNIEGKPGKIDLSLTNTTTGVKYEESILAANIIPIAPFSQKTSTVKTSLLPPAGMYNLSIIFYDEAGQTIFKHDASNQVNQKNIIPINVQDGQTQKIVAMALIFLILIGFLFFKLSIKK